MADEFSRDGWMGGLAFFFRIAFMDDTHWAF